jgi:hypothetical protein
LQRTRTKNENSVRTVCPNCLSAEVPFVPQETNRLSIFLAVSWSFVRFVLLLSSVGEIQQNGKKYGNARRIKTSSVISCLDVLYSMMVNLIPTLLAVLLNIHFLVQSAEGVLSESRRLRTNETWINGSQLFASPSNKYIRTDFPESLTSKGSHPSISLQSISPNLCMQLVAGSETVGYSGDGGPATSAQIRAVIPWVDTSGNIYLPDSDNRRIRKVGTVGIITTFGGTGTQSSSDGAGGTVDSVSFYRPWSIVSDVEGTVLYISDELHVWKYLFSTNIVTVFVNGRGFSGDNGPASLAQLYDPLGLWLSTTNVLYIVDYSNHRIRKVFSGIITTVVGSGCSNGCTGSFSGDNGPATSATLSYPHGVYMDTAGKLFVADGVNNRIRVLDASNIITTFAGTGSQPFNGDNIPAISANIKTPTDVKGDVLGNIYIADYNCLIRMVDTSGIISTLFGTPDSCGFSSGVSSQSSVINCPQGIWLDSLSNIYFSDYNSIHRSIIVSSPTSQPSGQPSQQPSQQPTSSPTFHPRSFDNVFMQLVAGTNTSGYGGDNGPATAARIRAAIPWVDTSGNIYVPDYNNYRIRKVSPVGIIITFGGTGVRSYSGSGGVITSVGLNIPWSIVGDTAGTYLYISDQAFIWKYLFSNNTVSVVAGTATQGQGFSGDNGPASSAQLYNPLGVWLTTAGDLYIADHRNNRIRKISSGIITTVAGNGPIFIAGSFTGDNGPATSASLYFPYGVYVDSTGRLFIADTYNNRIRSVNADNNIISTFAGTGNTPYNNDHIAATSANLFSPVDVKGDSLGNIYIADDGNCRIRMVGSSGIILTVFGDGACGSRFSSGVTVRSSTINNPEGIWIDSVGNIYFSDFNSIHRSIFVSSPTSQPSGQPTVQPTRQPSSRPSSQPTRQPSSFISGTLNEGLVAYYPFDGNARDQSGNGNNGVIHGGVSLVADRFGKSRSAYSFDGTSGYMFAAITNFNFVRFVSLSFWMKPSEILGSFVISSAENESWFFAQWGVINQFIFEFHDTAYNLVPSPSVKIPPDVWTHVVVTKGDQIIYYLNGSVADSFPCLLSMTGSSSLISVGARKTNAIVDAFYQGVLDDIFIFNSTLTQTQVHRLFSFDAPSSHPTSRPSVQPTTQPTAQPTTLPTVRISSTLKNGLVAVYPFDGNANDNSGNSNHGVVHGGVSLVADRFGNARSAMQFDGTSGYIEIPGNQFNFALNMSASLWFKPLSQLSTGLILDKSHFSLNNNVAQWCIYVYPNALRSLYVSTQAVVDPLVLHYLPNQWNQLIITKSLGALNFYLNGVHSTGTGNSAQLVSNGNLPLLIGANNNGYTNPASNVNWFFNGTIDDIFIYNRTLSFSEVKRLSQFNVPTSQPSLQPSSQPTSQPSLQPTTQPTSFISGTLTEGLVAYYPFDGNARDQSGNGNNGEVHNATLTKDRFGNPDSAYSFDGNTSYIKISNGLPFDFSNSFSVAFWVNRAADQYASIFSKSWNANVASSWLIYQDINYFFRFAYIQHVSNTEVDSQPAGVPTNQWNHYSIVKDSTKINTYLNGNLVSTAFGTYPAIKRNGNLPLFIGIVDTTYHQYFNGLVDDIFIFNRTLTANEVLKLYQFDAPTSQPTGGPTSQPSGKPSGQPANYPSNQPTSHPSGQPVEKPTGHPSNQPTNQPTQKPTSQPSAPPTIQPSVQPSSNPTDQPTLQPFSKPTSFPSTHPSHQPTNQPSGFPSSRPTGFPSAMPTLQPTSQPSSEPSLQPSVHPSAQPTQKPTIQPASRPSMQPTTPPSTQPSSYPTGQPRDQPTIVPSIFPTSKPTIRPTGNPSRLPSSAPSCQPTQYPSCQPTCMPTSEPTNRPSQQPSSCPSSLPSSSPSNFPTGIPTSVPTTYPTRQPSSLPTALPSVAPSSQPSIFPTNQPTKSPSSHPSVQPSSQPSYCPSSQPTVFPTQKPTRYPSSKPSSVPSLRPSTQPSSFPSVQPSQNPSSIPSIRPLSSPSSFPTKQPSSRPTVQPSNMPTKFPTAKPSRQPSSQPTIQPSRQPTSKPSKQPSTHPSSQPTSAPLSSSPTSIPTIITDSPTPLRNPSISAYPSQTRKPTRQPITPRPTTVPTVRPSFIPTSAPTQTISVFSSENIHFKESLFLFGSYLPTVENTPNIYLTEETIGSSYIIFGSKERSKPREINIGSRNSQGRYSPVLNEAGLVQDQTMSRTALPIGDFNGDSYEDLLICDPINSICFVYFGNVNGLQNLRVSFAVKSNNNDLFGWSIAKLNDAYKVIAISALSSNLIYLFFGSKNTADIIVDQLDPSVGIKIIGSRNDQNSGLALSSAGDFNSDGFSDILFSAIQITPYQNVIYILFLNSKVMKQNIIIDNLTPNKDYFKIIAPLFSFAGFSLSNLGDINQDGIDDIIIGSIPYSGKYLTQKSYVIYGRNSSNTLSLSEITEEDGFTITGGGFMVAGPGDVNDDGIPDIMISSYQQWQGKGNSYIMVYPRNLTSPPTFLPSSQPTSSPSLSPSTFPTFRVHDPTGTPTFLETTNEPVSEGTFPPFLEATQLPSLAPKTSKPTRVPSIKSTTHSPTVKTDPPSVSPTRKPTEIPTRRPTTVPSTTIPSRTPTERQISSHFPTSSPSTLPTESLTAPFEEIRIDSEGVYNVPSGKANCIISGEGSFEITSNGGGKKVYTILPSKKCH